MSALLGLAQSSSDPQDGARGALTSQMAVSAGLVTASVPKPTPKPGSAKAFARKVTSIELLLFLFFKKKKTKRKGCSCCHAVQVPHCERCCSSQSRLCSGRLLERGSRRRRTAHLVSPSFIKSKEKKKSAKKTENVNVLLQGANLLAESDPIISGVRSLGEQLAALSKAASSGDNAGLLAAGKVGRSKTKLVVFVCLTG
jgi:hypothetical protein